MKHRINFVCCTLMIFAAWSIGAAVRAAEPPKVKVETILTSLDEPTSIVIRPGTSELFISESGAGQVVRVNADKPAKPTPIVSGFPVAAAPAGLGFQAGPLGLAFLDRITFAVGCGGMKDGHDVLGIYTLPSLGKVLKFDEVRQKLGPVHAAADGKTSEGFLYGVAATPNALFVTSHGDDSAGWISRAFVLDNSGKAADLKPLIKTKTLTHVGGPMALTLSKRGELVVGECGAFDKPHDSVVSFYNPKNGKLLLNVPTGLSDIVGLAYHPRSGNLYAIDLSLNDGKEAGLYRIDAMREDDKMSAKAVKIAALDRPTAMAFAPDGALYITLLGTAKEKEDSQEKLGQIIKITGDLQAVPMSRREKLEALLLDDPSDLFLRYGLALEFEKEGNHDASLARLRELQSHTPPYVPAFFMAAQQLVRLARIDEARAVLRDGIEQARQQSNSHAAGEMSEFLASLGNLGE